MKSASRLMLLLLIMITATVLAQQNQPADQYERETGARIAALSERLSFRGEDPVDRARYLRELQIATDELRAQVDDYIQLTVQPSDKSENVQSRLRNLLALHKPNSEYADLPLASIGDTAMGRALIVAYTIIRPPHFDSGTIRGYRANLNRFELVARTGDEFGDDLDSYYMFTRQLRSPLQGEIWLLAWGQQHTFNGTKMLFRLYAFDGQRFRTVWNPPNMFNAEISFTSTGFVIEHNVRDADPPYDEHDEFVLTPNGVIKTLSRTTG